MAFEKGQQGAPQAKNKKICDQSHYVYENKGTFDKMPEKKGAFLYNFRTFLYKLRTFSADRSQFCRKKQLYDSIFPFLICILTVCRDVTESQA